LKDLQRTKLIINPLKERKSISQTSVTVDSQSLMRKASAVAKSFDLCGPDKEGAQKAQLQQPDNPDCAALCEKRENICR